MSFLDDLIEGRYKDATFLVRSETLIESGQSWVDHQYPKSSIQYQEPMGETPFNESISLYFSGEGYLEKFRKFQKAIRDPAPGRLHSPTFGIFNSIIALPGSFLSDHKELGIISAVITFKETTARPAPVEGDITTQDVSGSAEEAREELKAVFESEYVAPATLANIKAAESDGESLIEEVGKIAGMVRTAKTFIDRVALSVRTASLYGELLLNPGVPVGFLQSLALNYPGREGFVLFQKLGQSGNFLSNSMSDINSGITPRRPSVVRRTVLDPKVSFNINLWDTNTLERQERNSTRLAVINTFRITGLLGMLESASQINYTTTEDVTTVRDTYEFYYEQLIENDTSGIIIPRMKQYIDSVKGLVDSFLLLKEQQVYAVIELKLFRPHSTKLLAYKLYGEFIRNEEQLDFMAGLLKGLNQSQVADRLDGVVRVVSVG